MEIIRRVYIAGPYSRNDTLAEGNREANALAAIEAGDRVWKAGYSPFVPHLTHWWQQQHPHTYREWLSWCMAWVTVCDAVLRLPGDSPGADKETSLARLFRIPVCHSIDELRRICPLSP